jgi:hypothetical protein
MQGMHVFQPQARTAIDLESFVEDGHFLRKVHRVLQLSFVRELTASGYAAGTGGASEPNLSDSAAGPSRAVSARGPESWTGSRLACWKVTYQLASMEELLLLGAYPRGT